MITDETAKNVLHFGVQREIKYLFKYLLGILDDFEREGLADANSKAFFRAKILSQGNDALRSVEKQLDQFNVSFAPPIDLE